MNGTKKKMWIGCVREKEGNYVCHCADMHGLRGQSETSAAECSPRCQVTSLEFPELPKSKAQNGRFFSVHQVSKKKKKLCTIQSGFYDDLNSGEKSIVGEVTISFQSMDIGLLDCKAFFFFIKCFTFCWKSRFKL